LTGDGGVRGGDEGDRGGVRRGDTGGSGKGKKIEGRLEIMGIGESGGEDVGKEWDDGERWRMRRVKKLDGGKWMEIRKGGGEQKEGR